MTTDFKALLARAADQSISLRTSISLPVTEDLDDAQDEHSTSPPHLDGLLILQNNEIPATARKFQKDIQDTKDCLSQTNAQSRVVVPIQNSPAKPATPTVPDCLSTVPVMSPFDELCLNMIRSAAFQNATNLHDMNDTRIVPLFLNKLGLEMPLQFRSLCICDPKMMGHPIRLRSKYYSVGPRGLKVGECDYANLENNIGGGDSCKLSSRPGIDGRPRFILEYADWLVNGECGFPSWIVAAQVDVTTTIHDLVTASSHKSLQQRQLKTTQQSSYFEQRAGVPFDSNHDRDSAILMDDEAKTPCASPRLGMHENKSFLFHSLSDEHVSQSDKTGAVIDWIEAACFTPPPIEDPTDKIRQAKNDTTPASAAFSDLVKKIAHLHRFSFVLCPTTDLAGNHRFSPTGYWQVAAMSPRLFANTADRHAVLVRTPLPVLHRMGVALSRRRPVSFIVNWGERGVVQRLYCSPMLKGSVVACWLCFLVDPVLGDLWGQWGDVDEHE